MGFRRVYAPCYGIGALGHVAYQQAAKFRVYEFPPDQGLGKIQVYSPSKVFLGELSTDVRDVVLTGYDFQYGAEGSISFSLELNEEPEFPIVRFAEVVFWIGDDKVFRGYIWKYPGPEKRIDETFKYTGYGMAKRFEKRKIAFVVGLNLYNIDSIAVSGSTVTVYADQTLGYTEVEALGCICVVTDALDSDNDGRFDIIDVGSNYIRLTNPAGVVQAISKGLLYIYPREWSDPTTKISDLVKQVMGNYMDNIPISRTTALVDPTPAAVIGGPVDLDGMALDEFVKQMRKVVPENYLYVDADARVVFREKGDAIVATLVIGYDVETASETRDDDGVVNRLFVNRKVGKEDQRAGFINGGVASNETSIADVGVLEAEEDVPVYWSNALCQSFAEKQVALLSQTRTTVTLKDVPWAYYPIGLWRIITQPRRRASILADCEATTGWEWDSEMITLTADASERVFGARSLKAEFDETAEGLAWTYAVDFVVIDPERLEFFYKAGRLGQRIIFGYGENSYTENEVEVYGYSNQWRQKVIDISAFSGGRIREIGFRVEEANSGEGAAEAGIGEPGYPIMHSFSIMPVEDFRVDNIQVISTSSEHKTIELVNVKGKNRDGLKAMDLTFGVRDVGLDGEIVGLARSLKTSRLALRESN